MGNMADIENRNDEDRQMDADYELIMKQEKAAKEELNDMRNNGTDKTVQLKSTDGEIISIGHRAVALSSILSSMSAEFAGDVIPLQLVSGSTLRKVVEYCEYHKDNIPADIEKPLKSDDFAACGLSEWDFNFINIPNEQLQELILAANYLDIKPLL